jgi:FXSXX-COOH protein
MWDQELRPAIPDLREVASDRIAELGDTVLAHSIDLYFQRLTEDRVLVSAFNSNI